MLRRITRPGCNLGASSRESTDGGWLWRRSKLICTRTGFCREINNFSTDCWRGRMIWDRFKHITLIVHLIIITPGPPQIIRH